MMEVRGVVAVTIARVTSFRIFYERLDIPVFALVLDSLHRERVGLADCRCANKHDLQMID